ncbi:uncharacterized protein LOC125084008 [Lutra lutra]|uniref:uncharacterized protein LOC125084008 n=1 Tax=Lutra lutra TaxID=9657 RepID=UPI001FD16824|nr:uncharacterized protein LOC125084008 [Lutra lutra]
MDYFSTSVFNLIYKHNLVVRDSGRHYTYQNGCTAHRTGPGLGCCWDGAGCRCGEMGLTPMLETRKPLGKQWQLLTELSLHVSYTPASHPRAGVTEKGMLELTRPERGTQPSVRQRVARRLAHGGGAEPQTTWLSLQGAVWSDKGSPEGHTLGLFVCCWNERADGGHGLGRRWEEGGCGRKRATQGTLVVTGVLSPSLWQMCGPTRVTTLVHAHTHTDWNQIVACVWVTV